MSKIYDKYLELKSSSDCVSNTLYLFRTGLFYIFIDNDARLVSNLFNLKLGNLIVYYLNYAINNYIYCLLAF